jgi:hypothetical protein
MIRVCCDSNYGYDPARYLGLEKYIEDLSNVTIYIGYNDPKIIQNDTKKVRLNLETPNHLYVLDCAKEAEQYDLILHLCPYTCNYLNEKYNTSKFKPTFFPIDNYECKQQDRTIPVFYTGHLIHSLPIFHVINNELEKRLGSAQLQSLRSNISATNYNGYVAKLNLLNQTKICISHNVLSPAHTIPNFNAYKNDLLAIKHLPWHINGGNELPQLKSRIFEGALMGCILLVYKDEYKVIEKYFVEGQDFIYFTDSIDLTNKIDHILKNYDTFLPMIQSAQRKVKENYSSSAFIQMIKEELQLL